MLRNCEIYANVYDGPTYFVHINGFGAYSVSIDGVMEHNFLPNDGLYHTDSIIDDHFRRSMKYLNASLVFRAQYEDTFYDFVQIEGYLFKNEIIGDVSTMVRIFNDAVISNPYDERLKCMAKAMNTLNLICKNI